jgi:hypothetical protein
MRGGGHHLFRNLVHLCTAVCFPNVQEV